MSQKHDIDQAISGRQYAVNPEPTYGGVLSFVRRPYSKDLEGVDLAVWGIPYDLATTNRSGARMGPRAIRAASSDLAWERHWPWEFNPFEQLKIIDYGDCFFDPGYPDRVPGEIQQQAEEILKSGTALMSLGGDHFVALPLLRAHHAVHGPLALLHFDAHHDSWEDPEGRIDHGTMFRHAANEGIIQADKTVQIGIRTTNDDPPDGFQIIYADEVHASSPQNTAAKIRDVLGDTPTYLSFDIDCLDPAFAPGTGTPVCGGLSTHQALSIIRNLKGLNIVGMDLVEVAPAYDHAEITALAGATIALESICLFAAK